MFIPTDYTKKETFTYERHIYKLDLHLETLKPYTQSVEIEVDIRQRAYMGAPILDGIVVGGTPSVVSVKIPIDLRILVATANNAGNPIRLMVTDGVNEYETTILESNSTYFLVDSSWGIVPQNGWRYRVLGDKWSYTWDVIDDEPVTHSIREWALDTTGYNEDTPIHAFIQELGPVRVKITPFSSLGGTGKAGRAQYLEFETPSESGSGQVGVNKSMILVSGSRMSTRPMFEFNTDHNSNVQLRVDTAEDWRLLDPEDETFTPDFGKGACHRIKLTRDIQILAPNNANRMEFGLVTETSASDQIIDEIKDWSGKDWSGKKLVLRERVGGEILAEALIESNGDQVLYLSSELDPASQIGEYYEIVPSDGMYSGETLHIYVDCNDHVFTFSEDYLFPGGNLPKLRGRCHCNFIMDENGMLSGVVLSDMKTLNASLMSISWETTDDDSAMAIAVT